MHMTESDGGGVRTNSGGDEKVTGLRVTFDDKAGEEA